MSEEDRLGAGRLKRKDRLGGWREEKGVVGSTGRRPAGWDPQHSDAVVQGRLRIDGSRRIRRVRDGREGLGKG